MLFWNLLINLSFFTIGSIISLQMEQAGHATAAGAFALGSLVTIIVFGEMLPKSLGVLQPQRLAVWLAVPLAATVRIVDPLLPVFRLATLLSRRLLWPNFEPEPYLHVRDLERAVKLSGADAALVEQEAARAGKHRAAFRHPRRRADAAADAVPLLPSAGDPGRSEGPAAVGRLPAGDRARQRGGGRGHRPGRRLADARTGRWTCWPSR